MLQRKQIKTYEALGFVEALIAIIVAGVACVALMRISADTIASVTKSEISDEMTQIGIEYGTRVKAIANKNNNETDKYFPSISEGVNSCYGLNTETNEPAFETDVNGNFVPICNYDGGGREQCKNSTVTGNTDLFGVFCISSQSDSSSGLIVGKVVVGNKKCTSNESCDISDYEYFVLTKTLQK